MMKKVIAMILVIITILSVCVNVFAFKFPQPDWGALYYEREAMVTQTDFELYTQGRIDSAPYYGAKFEPRAGAYIGSIPQNSASISPIGSYLTYIEAMKQNDFYYPDNNMIKSSNVVTMAGWSIYDLKTVDLNQVKKVLNTLNSYNKPVLVRFANEMNCSNLGDDPDAYVKLFRQVADLVHQYPNLGVVWSPNDLGALDRPFKYFYPGDKYVDWVGVSNYMMKYFSGNKNTAYKDSVYFMTGDFSWATNKIKPFMEFLKANNIKKPVMISEGGVATSNKFGEAYESWTTPRLRNMLWYLVMKYPQIKMVNYFDTYRENAVEKFNITQYQYAKNIFNEAKNSGAYLTGYNSLPNFVFSKVNDAGTLVAKNGKIPFYTLAYIAKQPNLTVNYHVDGKWYHCSTQIPYTCNLNISNLSDGKHTIRISTINNEKTYTFYKKGNCIRFGAQPDTKLGKGITVTINGNAVKFDQAPVIIDGRTLVPLRAIFEALSATVKWDDKTQTVTATKGGTTVKLTLGKKQYYVNNKALNLDVEAKLMNGRTLVPARAVAESFSCKVAWDDASQTVKITK